MRRWLFVVLAAALGGCNMVVSDTPWFKTDDKAGGSALRDGVWASVGADCKFSPSDPFAQWPKCANGAVIHDHHVTFQSENNDGQSQAAFILSATRPPVWQLQLAPDAKESPLPNIPHFFYLGIRPEHFDEGGRITAFKGWVVQCGPPPQEREIKITSEKDAGKLDSLVTHSPFPGVKVNDMGSCNAESKDALVNAAKLSEALMNAQESPLQWVRDGEK